MEPDKKIILFIMAMAAFITPFAGSSAIIILPMLGREFSMSAVTLSWFSNAFLLSSATLMLPLGRVSDLYGRKKIFIGGLAVFVLTSLLLVLVQSADMIIFIRAVQGIGAAMLFSTSMPILVSVFKPEERGKILGISVSSTYLGLSLGPFIGGFLSHYFTWKAVFFFHALLGLGVLALVVLKLNGEWKEEKKEKFDFRGTLLYGAGFFILMYGFSTLPSQNGFWLISGGVFSLILFVFLEARTRAPILDVGLLFHNRIFAFSNLAALINYCATFSVSFLLSLYLQYIKGLTPQTAGLVLIAQPIMQTMLSPLAGRLSDKIDPQKLASLGMALSALGLWFLSSLNMDSTIMSILAILVLMGISFALFSSPNTNAIMGSVDKKYLGVASGMVGTMRLTGQMLSQGIATLVFALYLGNSEIVPSNYFLFVKSLEKAFALFAILCAVGVIFSFARSNKHLIIDQNNKR